MKTSFTHKIKDEIKHHIGVDEEINVSRLEYDKIEVKKDLRIKFIKYGMVYSPSSCHHLEFRFKSIDTANYTLKELMMFDIEGRLSINEKKKVIILYIVDAKTIMDTLNVLGAVKSLKEYKKVVDYKTKVKDTNRKVNFETANIKRAANASIRQLDDIKKLLKKYDINNLDKDLKVVVKARLKYKTLSVSELATKIGNVSKNVLNHRFRKIRKIIGE